MIHKGKIRIGKTTYDCEVKNGIRYVDGMTVEKFWGTLSEEDKLTMEKVGKMALEDEKKGITPPKGKYQYYAVT